MDYTLGILDECGYNRIILKSDNEPAIKSLKAKVKEFSKVEIALEEGKTGESKRQCRAMKSALQDNLGMEIHDRHPILTWMARHGNFLVSRFRVGPDGSKNGL